jgi:hypothetical protein
LNEKSKNNIEEVKMKILSALRVLISKSKEQRNNLFEILLNKLGDKSGKICGRALAYMSNIMNPGRTGNPFYVRELDRIMIVKDVSTYLFDPETKTQSQLYAVDFLSNIELNNEYDKELSKILIDTYIKLCNIYFEKRNVDTRFVYFF